MKNYTAFGKTQNLHKWAKEYNIEYTYLWNGINKHKRSIEECLTFPYRKNNQKYDAFGESKTINEWLKDKRCKVSRASLLDRIHSGLEIEESLTREPKEKFVLEKYINKVYNNIFIIDVNRNVKHPFVICNCLKCGKKNIKLRIDAIRANEDIACGCSRYKLNKENYHWKGYEEISLSFFNSIKKHARKRNIYFNIDIKEIWRLFLQQERRCSLSGVVLIFSHRCKGTDGTASLDRIDSTKGYESGNIQWIHKDLNKMKMDINQEKLIEWCCKVCAYKSK